jgi:hypothetical protein
MVDMQLIIYSAIGAAVLAAIALIGSNMSTIVSSLSRWNTNMIERGRAQRERRARVYMSSGDSALLAHRRAVSVSDTNTDTGIKPIDTGDLALRLTEDQYIEIGILMRGRSGKPLYSGKKLYGLAGGNYNDFVVRVRRLRGGDTEEESLPHVTPIVGRRTSAVFETDPDYPYQSPA